MSERKDGSMRLSGENVGNENRRKFFSENKIDKEKIISAGMVHGNKAVIVERKSSLIIKGADALVTKEKVFLAVTVADCAPVYFYDEKNKIVGLAHAGWRGVAGNIIGNTLNKMAKLGGNLENIEAVLGPGIRKCHFEIKEDILNEFINYSEFIFRKESKIFVDLFGIIKKQLLDFEIKEENIFDSGECTFENKKRYFSYRRDKPEVAEVMIAVIGMRGN